MRDCFTGEITWWGWGWGRGGGQGGAGKWLSPPMHSVGKITKECVLTDGREGEGKGARISQLLPWGQRDRGSTVTTATQNPPGLCSGSENTMPNKLPHRTFPSTFENYLKKYYLKNQFLDSSLDLNPGMETLVR